MFSSCFPDLNKYLTHSITYTWHANDRAFHEKEEGGISREVVIREIRLLGLVLAKKHVKQITN